MKFALLVFAQAFSVLAMASSAPVTLDSRGPVSFSSESVDCSAGRLTVMRRFRAEVYQIKADLCSVIQTEKQQFNTIGFDAAGNIALIGYDENGEEKLIVSSVN